MASSNLIPFFKIGGENKLFREAKLTAFCAFGDIGVGVGVGVGIGVGNSVGVDIGFIIIFEKLKKCKVSFHSSKID